MSLFRSCRATGGGKTFRIHNLLPSFFISLIRKFKTPWDKSEQTVIFWKQIMPKMVWRSFSKSILTLLSQIWNARHGRNTALKKAGRTSHRQQNQCDQRIQRFQIYKTCDPGWCYWLHTEACWSPEFEQCAFSHNFSVGKWSRQNWDFRFCFITRTLLYIHQ